jgi:hypothetical protein
MAVSRIRKNAKSDYYLVYVRPSALKKLGSQWTGFALHPVFENFSRKPFVKNSSFIKNLTSSKGALQEGCVRLL